MAKANLKETTGAWLVHHGRKLVLDSNGPAEFPAIDEAAKAASLLTKLGESRQATITKNEARAIAVSSGLNPRHELNGLLSVLEQKRLIQQSSDEISVLGVTTRGSLTHAADIFSDANPSTYELASLTLAEAASETPILAKDATELIGDTHQLTKDQSKDFLSRAGEIGFVDREGDGSDQLLFNGNLFRRDSVLKSQKVLSALEPAEQAALNGITSQLETVGCIALDTVRKMLGDPLVEKAVAAAIFDLNQVSNELGTHVYVTLPSAFHKFVDPMVDDTFDMAKSLVAALTYGMKQRASAKGRIDLLHRLLGNLIAGVEVGPATAIGEDYRVLEVNRVVKLRPDGRYPNRYHMRLLKKEVGELALQVLTQGDANVTAISEFPSAPMAGYIGPEVSRTSLRKNQTKMSRKTTFDVLEAVRGGRRL